MTTPVNKAFNAIVRKCTLPPSELLAILETLSDEVAQDEFGSIMTVIEAAALWNINRKSATNRVIRLNRASNGRIGRKAAYTWIIRRKHVEETK